MTEYRVKGSLGSWSFVSSQSITNTMCVPKIIQIQHFFGKRVSEAKSGEIKKPKFHEMLNLLCFRYKISSQGEIKKMNLCM